MKRKLSMALAIMMVLGVMLVGCGTTKESTKSAETETTKESTKSAEAETTTSAEKVEESDSTSGSKYVGTEWILTLAETQGMKLEGEELKTLMGDTTIKFEENKVTMVFDGESQQGGWTEKDDVITLTEDGGDTMQFKVEDSKLVVEYDGVKMYFEKK